MLLQQSPNTAVKAVTTTMTNATTTTVHQLLLQQAYTDLHKLTDGLAVRQDLRQVLGTQHITQGGGCQQLGGPRCILHIVHRGCGILDAVVDDSIYRHRHRVPRQHLNGKVVSYFCVLYFCICTCSAQLSMFHTERCSRNMLTIIITISCLHNIQVKV